MSLGWVQRGSSAHTVWLPTGAVVFRSWHNGADTEVRAPATLVLGPCGGVIWMGADWIFGPRGLAAHWCGIFRPSHNGADTEVRPPATRVPGPCGGVIWMGADWIFGPRGLAAPWGGGLPAIGQRADTEVQRPWAERVEQRKRKWSSRDRGPFSRADTEVRAPVTWVPGPFSTNR